MYVIQTVGYWGDVVYIPKKFGVFTKDINQAKTFRLKDQAEKYLDSFEDRKTNGLQIIEKEKEG